MAYGPSKGSTHVNVEYSTPGDQSVLAILGIVYGSLFLVGIVVYVLYALGLSKVFAKLGEPAWKGWVPVLNELTLLKLGGQPVWTLVLAFIPVANLAYQYYFRLLAVHRIDARFGKGTGFTVLGVLVPFVWALLLGGKGAQLVGGAAGASLDQQGGRFAPGVVAPGAVPPPFGGGYGSTAPPPPAAGQVPGSGFGQPSSQPGFAGATPPPPAPGARAYDAPPPPASGDLSQPPAPASAAPSLPSAPESYSAPPANPYAPPSAPPATGLIAPPPGIAPIPGVAPAAPPAPPAAPVSAPAPAAPPSWAPAAPPTPSAPPAPAFVAPVDVDDDDDDDDEVGATIVVDRKPRALWNLVLADGGVLPVTDEIVVLGRKPIEGAGAQSLSVPDTTRTLSKTHAKLELLQSRWIVTDLNSTNGVIVVRADGTEDLLDEGASAEVLDRFVLGKVELRLVKVGS
jgi:hypothetical protein